MCVCVCVCDDAAVSKDLCLPVFNDILPVAQSVEHTHTHTLSFSLYSLIVFPLFPRFTSPPPSLQLPLRPLSCNQMWVIHIVTAEQSHYSSLLFSQPPHTHTHTHTHTGDTHTNWRHTHMRTYCTCTHRLLRCRRRIRLSAPVNPSVCSVLRCPTQQSICSFKPCGWPRAARCKHVNWIRSTHRYTE